jgi:hypothetical protein
MSIRPDHQHHFMCQHDRAARGPMPGGTIEEGNGESSEERRAGASVGRRHNNRASMTAGCRAWRSEIVDWQMHRIG